MRIFASSKRLIALTVAAAAAVVIPAVVLAGFAPQRPTYTWNAPPAFITFNSITDNPYFGDERTFHHVRYANASTNSYVDSINVQDNQELVLRVFFHNNASEHLNLVAQNTRVRFALPTGSGTNMDSTAYISADNATPKVVSDTATYTSNKPFTLEYIKGSAMLRTNKLMDVPLSDDIVSPNGALVGYDSINGKVKGCNEFAGWVVIKVKVKQEQPKPKFACTGLDVNQVSRTRFDFTAHGSATNATIQSYVFTAKDSNGNVVDTKTVNTSATSANYTFNREAAGTYIISAVVNTNQGSTNPNQCVKQITVTEKDKPVFRCDALNVNVSGRKADATVTYTAVNGASFKSATFDWGDGNLTTTSNTTASHTYGADGNYTIAATLSFNVGNTTETARCTKSISITTPTPTPTPPAPTKLPETGPAGAAAVVTGVSALAGLGHYFVTGRRARN